MATSKKTPTAPTQKNSGEPVALKALTPIRHDGEDFAPGETFEAGPADAADLIKQGAAQAA